MSTYVDAPGKKSLYSRGVMLLTGCSYLCVALGFTYLHRFVGTFHMESILWALWTLAGFGGAMLYSQATSRGASLHAKFLTVVGVIVAAFPGLLMFVLHRWVGFILLLVIGARAALVRERRDFHITLAVIFVVSLLVATHLAADWTLWTYLAPAWFFAALALTWEHAAGQAVRPGAKIVATAGFVSVAVLLSALLFLFAPRPPVLGFGFLPPGTPGLEGMPGGGEIPASPDKGRAQPGKKGRGGGDSPGAAGSGGSKAGDSQWDRMLETMRGELADRSIPQWQRSLLNSALDFGQSLAGSLGELSGEGGGSAKGGGLHIPLPSIWDLLLAALMLVLLWLTWRRRFAMACVVLLGAARLVIKRCPGCAIRWCALALVCCLRHHGKLGRPGPGLSMREELAAAQPLPPLASRWMSDALDLYCRFRFGAATATPATASQMYGAVRGTCGVLDGLMPELQRA